MADRSHQVVIFPASYWTWCDQEWVWEPGKRCWVGAHVMTRPPPLILLLNCAFTCSLPPLLLFQHHHHCHRYHHSILAIIISFLKVMFTKHTTQYSSSRYSFSAHDHHKLPHDRASLPLCLTVLSPVAQPSAAGTCATTWSPIPSVVGHHNCIIFGFSDWAIKIQIQKT